MKIEWDPKDVLEMDHFGQYNVAHTTIGEYRIWKSHNSYVLDGPEGGFEELLEDGSVVSREYSTILLAKEDAQRDYDKRIGIKLRG